MSCLSAWLWGAEGGRGAVCTGLPQTAGLSGGSVGTGAGGASLPLSKAQLKCPGARWMEGPSGPSGTPPTRAPSRPRGPRTHSDRREKLRSLKPLLSGMAQKPPGHPPSFLLWKDGRRTQGWSLCKQSGPSSWGISGTPGPFPYVPTAGVGLGHQGSLQS